MVLILFFYSKPPALDKFLATVQTTAEKRIQIRNVPLLFIVLRTGDNAAAWRRKKQ